MFNDDFKKRYTTIPFAIYKGYSEYEKKDGILHQHKEIELIAMTEGTVEFYVNTQLYRLNKGDVLVIPPYMLHRVSISPDVIASYYCICFDAELLCDDALKGKLENNEKHLVQSRLPYAAELHSHIENAFLAREKKQNAWELDAMGHIFLAFGLLKKNEFFSQSAKSESATNFGKAVMTYIIENYAGEPNSRSAASALYMNNCYFCRLFKKSFGCSFSSYLLAFRLEKAKGYLSGTDLAVTEIAMKVGINDSSYFCKAFKSRFGITPLAYRKKTPDTP